MTGFDNNPDVSSGLEGMCLLRRDKRSPEISTHL